MIKLLPCPFCGSDHLDFGHGDAVIFFNCQKCGTIGPYGHTEQQTAEAWNRRASPWISVEDGLPGLCDLLFCLDSRILAGAFYPEINKFSDYNEDYEVGEVTHWMPMPDPPEGRKE